MEKMKQETRRMEIKMKMEEIELEKKSKRYNYFS